MKKNIHPEMKKITVKCTCGAVYKYESTGSDQVAETCRACHPAWTKSFEAALDKSDMISKFHEKMKKSEAKKKELAASKKKTKTKDLNA